MRVMIVFAVTAVVLYANSVEACSRVVYGSKYGLVISRTTDWEVFGHPTVQKTGRDQSFTLHNGNKLPVKYGFIAFHECSGKFSPEAHNEVGLSAATFYDDTAGFSEDMLDVKKGDVNTLFLPDYIASQFATVEEAVSNLKTVTFHAGSFDIPTLGFKTMPLHFQINDKSGHTVVGEFRNGKVIFYDNEPVITNEPQMPEQKENLKKYKPWGGNLDMPGDISSMDRFVRASNALAQIKEMDAPLDDADANAQGQHLLNALKTGMRQYSVYDSVEKGKYGTLWSTYYDTHAGKIVFQSQRRAMPVRIYMGKVKFEKGFVSLDIETLEGDITDALNP